MSGKKKNPNASIPYNAWVAMTPGQRASRAVKEPFEGWSDRADRNQAVYRPIEEPLPDMTLTGNMVSGSAYQNAAQKAADILHRKYNPDPSRPLTADESSFLLSWQNRPVGK